MRTTKVVSVSLPPTLLREAARVAKREGRTKSELVREALRRYLHEAGLRELQRYGARQSAQADLRSTDVARLIEEYRSGR